MKKAQFVFILLILALLSVSKANAQEFTVQSEDLKETLNDEQVFSGFGCTGKNISPSLKWINAPHNTKSFAVTVYDPDAPTGHGWWHWVIFNIPANTYELKKDAGNPQKKAAPKECIQSISDSGKKGFSGACPPVGDKPHRYIFTVYALKISKLDADEKTPPALVGSLLSQNAIATSSITAYYGR